MTNINYREDQIPIINYDEGTMAVSAVPGAGKTFIVTHLVCKLLVENKHENKKILVLTYMNSAVNNFKGRIKKILEDNDINNKNSYEVMTIHSLAVKIIKEKPEILMLNEEFSIADDLQKTIILNECIDNFKNSGGEKTFIWFLKEQKDEKWSDISKDLWSRGFYDLVSTAISKLKYKNINSDVLENKLSNGYKGILNIIRPIYRQYEMKLKYLGLLDYDDILILAYRALLIDENLKIKFQNRYKYVFEDECQDSNEIQGKIIKLICEQNNNLVRVGDINQSITGTFSSSDPKFFREFIKCCDKSLKMDMSNRSSKDIIALANRLVDYVTNEFSQTQCRDALEYIEIKTVPKGMGYRENPEPNNYNLSVKWYKTWLEEIEETVRFTKGIKSKYPDKSIGILVPYNEHISQVAKVLSLNNLEFEELGPNSSSKRKIIRNISLILDFIINCDNIYKLIDTLDKVFMKTHMEQEKLELFELINKFDTEELIYEEKYKNIVYDTESELYKSAVNAIESIKLILGYPLQRLDRLIMFIGSKLSLENEEQSIVDYVSLYIKNLYTSGTNVNLYTVYDLLVDDRNKLFSNIIEIVYDINGYEPEPGSITVCNYHKSKGMEWDCVFLLGLTEYNFPSNLSQKFQCDKWYLKDKYKNPTAIVSYEIDSILTGKKDTNIAYTTKIELINEKMRLLYVGITRAKEMIILSGSSYKEYIDIGNKSKEQHPCIYVKELSKFISLNRKKE